MKSLDPDVDTLVFGAGVLQRHVAALRQEIDGARKALESEPIHQMRVATRRIRTALSLFGDCFPDKQVKFWQEEIRCLGRALGAARDMDVQSEFLQQFFKRLPEKKYHLGIKRLLLRLTQKRQKLQPKVEKSLSRLLESGAIDGLVEHIHIGDEGYILEKMGYSEALLSRSEKMICLRLDEFLSYEEFLYQPQRVTEIHAMRIAAKRLRYTMDTFLPLYPKDFKSFVSIIRTVQECLGNIHDCDVWIAFLPQFIEQEKQRALQYFGHGRPFHPLMPGFHFFQQDRQVEREQQYNDFVSQWQQWKAENCWEGLRHVIHQPLLELTDTDTPNAGAEKC